MIDLGNPIATPFRAQWAVKPRTDFEFRTDVFTAADGTEQRRPKNRYPSVKIRYQCLARDAQHADRITRMMPVLMTSALAIRDFRLSGEGLVAADGHTVRMSHWFSSWAVGVRVIVEDDRGRDEHTAVVSAVDAAARTITLDAPAPEPMRGRWAGVASAVVASLDGDLVSERQHAGAVTWDVVATSFRGLDQIGGAPLGVFPFRHGADAPVRVTSSRSVIGVDFGTGRRLEVPGYASGTSGFRTFQIEGRQMSQSAKEALVSFFCGCRGRLRAFDAPDLVPGARFRFASDILTMTHDSAAVSSATMNLAQVIR